MNIVEKIVAILAPHRCVVCKSEGQPICRSCSIAEFVAVRAACYRCKNFSNDHATCLSCLQYTPIQHIWSATPYFGVAKDLVGQLKFERGKAIAINLAQAMNAAVPLLAPDTLVSCVPTTNSRIRSRGYDQAQLIAREFAKLRGLAYVDLLIRKGSTRQVGSSRAERFEHLESAYLPRSPPSGYHSPVLLIDDVLTTGATLESAAKVLEADGAETIYAATFSRAL